MYFPGSTLRYSKVTDRTPTALDTLTDTRTGCPVLGCCGEWETARSTRASAPTEEAPAGAAVAKGRPGIAPIQSAAATKKKQKLRANRIRWIFIWNAKPSAFRPHNPAHCSTRLHRMQSMIPCQGFCQGFPRLSEGTIEPYCWAEAPEVAGRLRQGTLRKQSLPRGASRPQSGCHDPKKGEGGVNGCRRLG